MEDADDLMPVFRQYTSDMNEEYGTAPSHSPLQPSPRLEFARAISSLDEGGKASIASLVRAAGNCVGHFSACL